VAVEQRQPKQCPLCGSNLITQVFRDTRLSAHFRGLQCPSEGVVAYHCEEKHVFLLLRNDFRWGQPIPADPEADQGFEARSSLASHVKPRILNRTVAAIPFFWFLVSEILGRQHKIQTLELLRQG